MKIPTIKVVDQGKIKMIYSNETSMSPYGVDNGLN